MKEISKVIANDNTSHLEISCDSNCLCLRTNYTKFKIKNESESELNYIIQSMKDLFYNTLDLKQEIMQIPILKLNAGSYKFKILGEDFVIDKTSNTNSGRFKNTHWFITYNGHFKWAKDFQEIIYFRKKFKTKTSLLEFLNSQESRELLKTLCSTQ